MKRRIRITSIRRNPPDTTLLAQVLIELVMHQREQAQLRAEKAGEEQKAKPKPAKEDRHA